MFASMLAMAVLPGIASAQNNDSASVRRLAERSQVRFERIRKMNLPQRHSGGASICDARIGRMCHRNAADDTIPAKDSRIVVRERAALLARLDTLSRKSPRDGWITGQRIRYLLETRDDSTALKIAMECRAAAWWCDALRGLSLHEAGAGVAADSAFTQSLATMPEKERCLWTDMTPLLDPAQRKRYGKVGCGRNDEVASRLWWLADPFLSVPGNDRQAEHFSRHTMAKILEPTRIAFDIAWANDLREMIVRYGWSRYWTRGSGTQMDPYGGTVTGHEATPNYHFIPASLSLDSLHEVSFDLDEQQSPERYAPVFARRVTELSPQMAIFRRGDSAHVVVAFDIARFEPFDTAGVRSALVLAPDEHSSVIVSDSTPRRTFSATIDSRPHVLSLEVRRPDKRHAAWLREGVWLPAIRPGEVALSDVLLFAPGSSEVAELRDAIPTALPDNVVKRGKTGLYWEIYGLARADSALPVSLTLTQVGQGTLRRIGESIGLTRRASPLNIAWRDTPGLGTISTRSVVLDLSLIPRGRYVLKVEVKPTGKAPVVAGRTVEIQ